MASQEEDNKLECISNVNKEQERYFLNVYKKHECILNNKNESFENKVESLIDVWKSVGELNLSQFDIRHVIQIMDWAKLHALNIVLTAEWNAYKATHQANLLQEIEKAQNELLKLNSGFATRCKKLADVVKNPWEDSVLMTLMKTKDAEIGPAEIEFFCVETAYVISVRLKKLCESQCEDLALNLVTAFMNCNKLSKTQNFNLNATETQMWFIFDIYIALLYKFQEKQKIVLLLKELTFEQGLQLVKRFAKKRVKISKIWKNCHRVAVLATQMYISQAAVKYTDDLKEVLENYIEVYISLCNTESLVKDFTTSIRRISNLADAAGLYVFCDVIQKKAGTMLKPFVIEMYIRALTTDMNDLERQKDADEKDKVTAITSRLAEAFCNLADFLDEHVKVARECVLTAFSLEPTKVRLQNLETLARRSGYHVLDTGQEWKCKLHPPILPSDDVAWICPECGDWMCKPQLNIPLKINMALNEALQNSVLGISESLCDDLVVCLSNPRYQILSWLLPWDDLHRLCIMYLQDPQTTKNFVTELKFVDIDYSIFKGIKREPLDELAGIERGYEQYLDQDFVSDEETSSVSGDSMSQDSRPYSLGSDGAGEGPYLPLLLSQPKSDPNTLKSLRMFRPNLKRMRTNESVDSIPEKLHKGESGMTNLNQPQTVTSNFKDPLKMVTSKPSLSNYLNGITTNIPTVNTNNQDSHSKNVKAATLPPLGGQVANKEMKSIQVLLQPLKSCQIPKSQADQALKPYNQTKGTITEATKKELMLKLLSKPLLSGSKENNNHKVGNKSQDCSPPTMDAKISIKSPTKINKEPKTSPVTTHTTEIKLQQPFNLGTIQVNLPPNLDRLTNTTDLHKAQTQSQLNLRHQQTQEQSKLASLELLKNTLCPHLQRWQPNQFPTLDPLQSLVLKKENPNPEQTLNISAHSNEYKVSSKMDKTQTLDKSTVTHLMQNLSQNTTDTRVPKEHQSISLDSERAVSLSQSRMMTRSPSNMEGAQSPELEKIQIQSDRKLISPSPVDPTKYPNLEKALAWASQLQTKSLLVEPTKSPNLEKVLAKPNQTQTNPCLVEPLKSHNLEKALATPNKIRTCLCPLVEPSRSPNMEKALATPDMIQTSPYPLVEPVKSPNTEKALAKSDRIETSPSPLVEPLKSPNVEKALTKPDRIETSPPPLAGPLESPNLEKVAAKQNLEKALAKPDRVQTSLSPLVEPLKSPHLEKALAKPDRIQTSPSPLLETLKSPNVEKVLAKPNKIQINTSPLVEPLKFPQLEKALTKPDRIQTNPSPLMEPLKSPDMRKAQAKSDRIYPKHRSLLEKVLTSTNVKTVQSSTDRLQNKLPSCPETPQLVMSPCSKTTSSQDKIQNKLSTYLGRTLPATSLCLEKNTIKFDKMGTTHPPSTEKEHQLISPTSDDLQLVPVRTSPKVQENSDPPILQNLKKDQKQPEVLVQKKEEPLSGPSLEKIPPSLSITRATHPAEKMLQNSVKIQVTINLDQMETKPYLNTNETLAPLSLKLVNKSCSSTKSFSEQLIKDNRLLEHKISCYTTKKEVHQTVENQMDSSTTKNPEELKNSVKRDKNGCILDKLDIKCNNTRVSGSDVQTEKTAGSVLTNEQSGNLDRLAPVMSKNCLGVIDDGIFSDLTDNKPEDLFFQNNNDYSSFVRDVNVIENGSDDDLPKNFNLTENIRTYTKKSMKKLPVVNKDCVKMLTGDDKLDICKNVYSSNSIQNPHSDVQKPQTNCRELKVVLYRLPSTNWEDGRYTPLAGNMSIKKKCDRGNTPPRNVRRRKSMDKSENRIDKAPNRVQNHKFSPLQDINPRVPSKENSKLYCDDLTKPKTVIDEFMIPRVLLERIHVDNKSYARSVLANVPGLNDYQMIRPTNVNHIVNVVQVSGSRQSQSGPIQSTQTSTQVSPHIQRIGQPRVAEQKPEHSNSVPSTTTLTTTTTTAKTTTTQPSTLINILSQQIIRPVTTQTNTVRRQAPLINILSQQIIRPSQTQKTAANANVTSDNNQVKPAVTTEQTVNSQVNNVAKNANAGVKTAIPTTTGQGSTILQFICKSSLPKFQQAFGKSVYQNSTETTSPATTTVETNVNADAKKNITKTVPVNVQPIQGSVIYSRQVPVGQTISLIPPGGTTRQVFRIATSNPEQISLVKDSVIHSKMSALLAAALQARPKNSETEQGNNEEKISLARPTLVQNARIVKPVQLQIPPNVVRATPQTNLSSTTLEQLREFDMVYKQVKERSSSTVPTETSNGPPENQEVTQQRISVTYVNQLQKYTQLSPVVVVSTYNNLQPAASPALSVTSQGSSSPCVTPAPTPTLPKIATKSSKGKTLKNTTNNSTAKSSPIPKPQQKPQEDEHTTQRIFDILAEYAEQLRNSPDLNNKPAPRRRSNPPTNPSQNSKRKKSSSGSKKSSQTSNTLEIDADDITVGSEDSSGGGIVQLSVTDDEQSQAATINTPESTENSSPSSSRQLILTEGTTCGNQSRNLIITDSSVGEALKMPNTAVIVPGSYIMPVSMVKGGQQIAVVSGGSKILATVPARSGQNMLLFQSFMNQNRKGAISAVKYSAIQPISGISSQSLAGVSAQPPVILPSNSVATAVALGQPLTLKKLNDDRDSNELLLTISHPKEDSKNRTDLPQPDSSTSVSSDSNDIKMEETTLQSDNSNEKIFQTYQKSVITNSVATSVIATASNACIKEDEENHSQNIINMTLTSDNIKGESKPNERMQSVLVTACSSNGPMLSHTTPRYRKSGDTGRTNNDLPNKEEFLHNGEKTSNNEQKTYRSSTAYYINKTKKNCVESQKMDSEMQKQAAIERELRLQKSLSEECEDLGVDEPSTSDLFPEADLLFDSNHSPFDQSSQDIIKRVPQTNEIKEEVKGATNLFSDDENSGSLRTDLFEYVEYQTVETALDYQARQLMNGNTTSNESGSSGGEDNTLLAKCPTMSEVTLNSPISPELYTESSLNKYKFKYSNRKKGERMKQSDFRADVVSSSEDTVGSTELGRINCEDDNFKLVHVAITKTDIVKEDEKCELHCDEDLDSPSGRGARRSVRKLCSCCNGSQDGNISRKRPHTSRPHTPATPHKKAFLNKKR